MYRFITLATNDQYAKSALVLNKTIKNQNSIAETCVLVPKNDHSISKNVLDKLFEKFDHIIYVDLLQCSKSASKSSVSMTQAEMTRPELSITLTKIHCFNLTEIKVGIFVDADCLLTQNIDELFSIFDKEQNPKNENFQIAAAPEFAWPDSFNSGVFVFKPNKETFQNLVNYGNSYDGGDQGLLNEYWSGFWIVNDEIFFIFLFYANPNQPPHHETFQSQYHDL